MTRWVLNRYRAVHGDAATAKLTDQDVRDLVVHYGAIGKRIYPSNLPCGETKWGQLADSIRKAALAGLEADLRSGAFTLVRNSSPADNPGGVPMPGPSTTPGNLPGAGSKTTLAGFGGWVALVLVGALLLTGIRK